MKPALIVFTFLMSTVAAPGVFGQAGDSTDLLDIASGAMVLSATSMYDDGWHPLYLIDGTTTSGWCCEQGKVGGNEFVIELARTYALTRFVIDNSEDQDGSYPGISTKGFKLYGSSTSAQSGWTLLLQGDAARAARKEFTLPPGSTARWLKLEIVGNYGEQEFVELMELEAYGTPSGPAPKTAPVSGVFDTTYDLMKLAQAGTRIYGCYDYNGGRLLGSTDGRVVSMEWFEGSGEELTHGTVLMILDASGEKLNGFWYRDGERAGFWFGDRVRDGRQPECRVEENSIGAALSSSGSAVLYGLYFDTDSAVIKAESQQTLEELYAALDSDAGLRIEIGGHTDSTGTAGHNDALSQSRAEAVKTWLVEKGIEAERLSSVGYGSSKPVADNNTEEGRRLNRRVEIRVR